MASKGAINRNNKILKLVESKREKREMLKKKIRDLSLDSKERFAAQLKLDDMPKSSSPVRYRNRCQITGRARGCYRKFGLSRIKFRELALAGMIPGVRKVSWWGIYVFNWSYSRHDN